MKVFFTSLMWFLSITFVSTVSSEFYQYIDKNGTKQFTDDVSKIPEDQRQKLNIYQSVDTPQKGQPPSEKKIEKPELDPPTESLLAQKKVLDAEFESLMKRKQGLEKEKERLGNKKYNLLVKKLMTDMDEFKEKCQAFETLVKEHNKKFQPKEEETTKEKEL